MKLISVQSRGSRLVIIEKNAETEGVGWFTIWLKTFSRARRKFVKTGFWCRSYKSDALRAAEKWLAEAKE